MKRFLTLALASLTVLPLVACGGGGGQETAQTAANVETAVGTPTEAVTDRAQTKDNLPADLDFKGEKITVLLRDTGVQYMFGGEELTGDVVTDANYNRRTSVEERLKVKFDFKPMASNSGGTEILNAIIASVTAGTQDWDITYLHHGKIASNGPLGYFRNMVNAPYIDCEQPWWNLEYMNLASVSEDKRYLIAGDITPNLTDWASCMFFNKAIYTDIAGNPDALYSTVLEGKWTLDLCNELCQKAYIDLNGNGEKDIEDRLGECVNGGGSDGDHWVYTLGMQLTERNKAGNPAFVANNENNVRVIDACYNHFFETKGVLHTTEATPFGSGNVLFCAKWPAVASTLREMQDPYGIIPMPKLNEEQENYIALVQNSSLMMGVPMTVPDSKFPTVCAVLEAWCAENYRTVMPAIYEVALKSKYSQDSLSSQMIDIIHDHTTTDFAYICSTMLGGTSIGTIHRTLYSAQSKDFASKFASLKPTAEKALADAIAGAK